MDCPDDLQLSWTAMAAVAAARAGSMRPLCDPTVSLRRYVEPCVWRPCTGVPRALPTGLSGIRPGLGLVPMVPGRQLVCPAVGRPGEPLLPPPVRHVVGLTVSTRSTTVAFLT